MDRPSRNIEMASVKDIFKAVSSLVDKFSFSDSKEEATIPRQLRIAGIPTDANILELKDYFVNFGFNQAQAVGRGMCGEVLKVTSELDPSNVKAVKQFPFYREKYTPEFLQRMFFKEIAILQALDHRHILRAFTAYRCPAYGVLEMEYYPEGTLREIFTTRPVEQLYRYFVQTACAVHYLHSKRYIHRDIKLDNILIRGEDAVLIDFGLADYIPEDVNFVNGWVGTHTYMAPEVRWLAKGETYDPFLADAFSLGLVLWAIATRRRPTRQSRYRREIRAMMEEVDPVAYDVILSLVTRDPAHRCTVGQALDYFSKKQWNSDIVDSLK